MIIGYIDSVVIEATEDFSDIRKELAALNPEAYPLLYEIGNHLMAVKSIDELLVGEL